MKNSKQLLEYAKEQNATDIHICAGAPILFRVNRKLLPVTGEKLTPEKIDQLLNPLKNQAEIPDTTPESPIFLVVMANSGIPLYTKIFSKELDITEELFSGFLSAFNTFSDDIFSEGLDRAHFGKFTILMTGMPPFISCYVFKGQSFLAQQKFAQFNETLHETELIW